MNLTTFGILDEFRAIEELANTIEYNEETGELIDNSETIKELMDSLVADKETKLDNIEYIKRDFKAKEDALQAEIKRLTERKASMKSKQEQLRGLQEFLVGEDGVKTTSFTFFYGTSKSVDIIDEGAIPEAYIKTEFKVNKTEITKALKSGGAVSGAELKEKTTLRVR